MTPRISPAAYFVVDTNIGYAAKHLRQLGYNAESVIEVNRRLKMKPKLHRDEQILNYVKDSHAVLITADRVFYNRCVNVEQPAIFIEYQVGGLYSKLEQMMILQRQLDPTFFQNWLAMGRPHWASYLKFGEGNWDEIRKETRFAQSQIDQIMNFDPLGYPRLIHEDRQMRIWGGSKRIKRVRWRKKINGIIAERRRKAGAQMVNATPSP
ncbi:MAG: hypothetical protein HRF40_10595 [Nitrososphaera sp.]|jgi:hypothetical protein